MEYLEAIPVERVTEYLVSTGWKPAETPDIYPGHNLWTNTSQV